MGSRQVTTYIDGRLYQRLAGEAKRRRRSVSWLAAQAIERMLDKEEKEQRD